MYGLEDYTFTDEDERVIERVGLVDDEAAEDYGMRLCNREHKTIKVFREVCTCDVFDVVVTPPPSR